MTKRTVSIQSQVAKLIRAEFKKAGITDVKVKSSKSGHSGKVDITVVDKSPKQVEDIKKLVAKYKCGHFDGMQDMYVYSNTNKDVPQVEYIFVSMDYSKELKQVALDYLAKCYKLQPMSIDSLPYSVEVDGRQENPHTLIRKLLTGADSASNHVWEAIAS